MITCRLRPKLKYSLATLLVLVTTFGIWLGLLVHRVNKQRDAVRWVLEMEGGCYYDFMFDERGTLLKDSEEAGPTWIGKLIGIDYVADIIAIDLNSATQVSDVNRLAGLASLEMLYLDDTHVNDLAPLEGLVNLEVLDANGTRIRDLRSVSRMKNLVRLSLNHTYVNDLTPIAKLENLRFLFLNETNISDLAPLAETKNLEILYLAGTQVSDLAPLAKLTNLKQLVVSDSAVGDVKVLHRLTDLKYLNLHGARVDLEAVVALRQALPNCEVVWE